MYYCKILEILCGPGLSFLGISPLTHKTTSKMNYLFIIHPSKPMILHVQPNDPLIKKKIQSINPHFNDTPQYCKFLLLCEYLVLNSAIPLVCIKSRE